MTKNIIIFCPRETVAVEPAVFVDPVYGGPLPFAEDAVEDMVVALASVEAAWADGDFERMESAVVTIGELAERTGLPDVASVAHVAEALIGGFDSVALAAVVARLIRVGETSLATLLDISYRQL